MSMQKMKMTIYVDIPGTTRLGELGEFKERVKNSVEGAMASIRGGNTTIGPLVFRKFKKTAKKPNRSTNGKARS